MSTKLVWLCALLVACPKSNDDQDDVDADTDTDTDADSDTDADTDTDTETGGETGTDTGTLPADLAMTVLATGLDNPFEITPGLDDTLWVTERTGKRVTAVSTLDGTTTTLLTIPEVLVTPGTQDGLLGLAIHPDLLANGGNGDVYLAHTYDADPDPAVELRQVKIVRYTYDAVTNSLASPVELLSALPGSSDHNGGRLVFGPDDKLYYSIGDQGHNQLSYYCLANHAQELPTQIEVDAGDWSAYQGKVLRLLVDGGIPNDNPLIDGVKSHVWTWGHRNPQGLAFGDNGALYEVEHGPKSDDELNLLDPATNYGWPYVAGFQDDQAYVWANWSASANPPCEDLVYSDFEIPPSVPTQEESQWAGPFQPPEMTFYTVPDDFDFQDPDCADDGLYFICWPTIAPSSVSWFGDLPEGIPGLQESVLITSLKLGTLFEVSVDAEGIPSQEGPTLVFSSVDRYRDTAVSENGAIVYVATDSAGLTMGADGHPTDVLEHPGSILALTPE